MAPTSHGEIVGKFVAAHDRQIGQENLISQICETWDIESHLASGVGNYVKVVVTPLHAGFIRSTRAELVEPGTLERVVIGMDRTSSRKARQGLHIGILFEVMHIAVAEEKLVLIAELVIEAAGSLVLARGERKKSAVSFKLDFRPLRSPIQRSRPVFPPLQLC